MVLNGVRFLPWPALAVASAAATFWCWQLPTRRLGLEVLQLSGDQVRIAWNSDSAPALLAPSGEVDIQDGASFHRVPLSREQVRRGSLVYLRETADVRVKLRIDSAARWANLAPVLDAARFESATSPAVPLAGRPLPVGQTASPGPDRSREPERAEKVLADPVVTSSDRVAPPRRAAVIPERLPRTNSPGDPLPAPPAPSLAILHPAVSLPALTLAPPPVVTPPRPAYSGPRYGRIMWTGSMGRRGVVEIEGARASTGSISGGLPGVPVTVRVSPAEFSPQGLVVDTTDVSSDGKREIASAANGWNATLFRWEPVRARELVVLEAPNPSNDFKRLAVRNDARTCAVMLVEWTVQ